MNRRQGGSSHTPNSGDYGRRRPYLVGLGHEAKTLGGGAIPLQLVRDDRFRMNALAIPATVAIIGGPRACSSKSAFRLKTEGV